MQLEEQKRETDRVQSEGELEIDKVPVLALVANRLLARQYLVHVVVRALDAVRVMVAVRVSTYTYKYVLL